ncbi:protein of unknown function [Saccharopolyspora antimicrobica]|uniref:Uncharacterized protein DUF4132 n=1 Tax=Saccharopolyspora antimicrobica TaxID=455193 RepID=A0A1I4R8U4_9PSEU|nr:DUF4132 domain-containing protein [Saccharopolyspora antimicrobica]RKT88124.1 uncharacterized protein DUF4132 [Saccharopolyspora antimicrobica]SFM48416.1 protein of unknown function [Saccharopolyspora antimicrobica]
MGWIGIATGHELTVEGTLRPVLACRTAAGRVLAKVPANVKKDPAAVGLAALCDRLGEHARAVHDRVESWMVRSLPVPAAVLAGVWDDPVWRETLTDLVIAPILDGAPDLGRCVLLREGAWEGAEAFAIPHPLLLGEELPSWQERNLGQVVEQVDREVWRRPVSMDRAFGVVDTFGYLDARYESGAAFERRVHELGGRIKRDRARFTVHAPEPLGVEIDVDWSGPMSPAYMAWLSFASDGREIGDIAWSEGVRILMALYAKRTVDDAEPVVEPAEAYSHYCDAHQGEPGTVVPSGITVPTRTALLRAGAVMPGAPAGSDEDTCVAVRYEHPVLDEPVIELLRRAAVNGDKAEKSLHGLAPVAETGVGTVHADPLGFLASALHSYPAHRAHILAAHTDLQAARGLASRRPGFARTALTRTGDALEARAPELLPLFYEECALILAAVGSDRFAAAFFEKARAAEDAHALLVDEAALVAAHLAAGPDVAATATLKKHRKRLATRHPAPDAYRWHRSLLTEWCEEVPDGAEGALVLAEGWAALAKAAGHALGGPEDERAVRALLASGCMESAPQALWKFVLPLLGAMARADAGLGRALLGVLPLPAKDTPEAKSAAVSLLLANLTGAGMTAPFTTSPGLAGTAAKDWLGRFLKLYAGLALPVAGLGDLLHDAGARLRAEGLACDDHEAVLGVDEDEVNRWEETAADLPLLDLLLERGVPLARPRLLHTFKLYDRLAAGTGTDLAAVAADPDWAVLLRDAVVGNVTNQLNVTEPAVAKQTASETVRALTTTPGTAQIVAAILAEHAQRVPDQGLPDAHAALCDAERFTIPGVPALLLDSVRTIATGTDPARALAATLSGGVLDELELPAFVPGHVSTITDYLEESGTDLLLIESGRLWEHKFRASVVTPDGVGPSHGFGTYEFVSSRSHERTEARDLHDRCLIAVNGQVTVLDHGGPHCPHGSAHPAADRVVPADGERVVFPGGADATVWRGQGRIIELRDPAGRAIGRYVRGWGRVPEHDGAENIGVVEHHRYASGTRLVAPPGWWSAMRPRDPGGSRALRAVDEKKAQALIDVADAALTAELMRVLDPDTGFREQDAARDELAGRLRPLLPEITDESLWKGVTFLVWTAVECRERAFALLQRLALTPPPHLRPAPASAAPAVGGSAKPVEPEDPGPESAYERIVHFTRAAVDVPYDKKIATFDSSAVEGVENTLGRLGAAVLDAAWGNLGGRARLLELAAVPDLLRTDGTWHVARLRPEYEPGQICSGRGPIASAAVADREVVGNGYAVTALLHTPGGPDPLLFTRNRVVELRTCRGWGDPDRLRLALELITENGPPPVDREAAARAFAEATGLSPAQCLILLSTSARTLSWPEGWARGRVAAFGKDNSVPALDLTELELRIAALSLEAMTTTEEAVEVGELLMPEDPADLWRTGPDLDRAVAYWTQRHPRLTPLTTEQWVDLASGAEDALEALIALLGERRSVPPLGHIARAALLADRLPEDHPARATAAARLRDLHEHLTAPETILPIATGVTSVTALERAAGATAAHLPGSRLAIGEALVLEPAGDGYRVDLRPSRWPDLAALAPALRRGGATGVALVVEDLRFLRSSEPLEAAARLE